MLRGRTGVCNSVGGGTCVYRYMSISVCVCVWSICACGGHRTTSSVISQALSTFKKQNTNRVSLWPITGQAGLMANPRNALLSTSPKVGLLMCVITLGSVNTGFDLHPCKLTDRGVSLASTILFLKVCFLFVLSCYLVLERR